MAAESDRTSVFEGRFGRHFNWTMAVAALGVILPFGLLPFLSSINSAWGRGDLGQFVMSIAVLLPPLAWLILVVAGFLKYGARAFWLLLGLPLAGLYWIFVLPCMTGMTGCL